MLDMDDHANLMLLAGQVLGEIDSKQLGQGFRTPGLIRFVSQDTGYLSPTSDGPRMFVNLEDYLSRTTGTTNADFQVTMSAGLCNIDADLEHDCTSCLVLYFLQGQYCASQAHLNTSLYCSV